MRGCTPVRLHDSVNVLSLLPVTRELPVSVLFYQNNSRLSRNSVVLPCVYWRVQQCFSLLLRSGDQSDTWSDGVFTNCIRRAAGSDVSSIHPADAQMQIIPSRARPTSPLVLTSTCNTARKGPSAGRAAAGRHVAQQRTLRPMCSRCRRRPNTRPKRAIHAPQSAIHTRPNNAPPTDHPHVARERNAVIAGRAHQATLSARL